MVTVLNESVSEWSLGHGRWSLCILLLSQQEVNHLLQQSLGGHLPDDPVQQGRGRQDPNLRPVSTERHRSLVTTHWQERQRTLKNVIDWLTTYVCISCGSITDTKNRSLTAFAISVAANWKEEKQRKAVQPSVLFWYKKLLWIEVLSLCHLWLEHDASKHSESAVATDLVSLLDQLVTVIEPGQEGDESPLPCEHSSILLQVVYIQTGREKKIKQLFEIIQRECRTQYVLLRLIHSFSPPGW